MFCIHTALEESKNVTITGQFGFVFEETSVRQITWLSIMVMPLFSPLSVFGAHENEKLMFSNSSSYKSVFKTLRSRDGAMWTVDLIEEIKLRIKISPA